MSNLPPIAFGVECNTPEDELVIVSAGICNLAKCDAVKSVVVSTMPGKGREEQVFGHLLSRCRNAGLTLIPGLKASPAFPIAAELDGKHYNRFDSLVGWGELADSVTLACHYAESPSVVLDLESASRGYVNGVEGCEINLAFLVECIHQLPAGIDVAIYPTLTSVPGDMTNPQKYAKQMTIVRAFLSAHGACTLVDTSLGAPSDFNNPRVWRNEDRLREFNRDFYPWTDALPMYRKMWWYNRDKYWRDAEAMAVMLGQVKAPDVALIYTSFDRFLEGTETIARLLRIASGERV